MGEFSKAVFGRNILPNKAIIRAGAHFPERAQRTLDQFDEIGDMKGNWMPYCYVKKNNTEMIVIFNVYGAATTLEVLRILEDGGVTTVGFIGSAFSKEDEIGKQLLVTKVYDQAGITQLDGTELVERRQELIAKQREIFDTHDKLYSEVVIASVPCVMHNIESIRKFVEKDEVDGVEMELSTYFYFAEKAGMDAYAFVYVSDNPDNSLIQMDKQHIRNDAMIVSSKLLINLILG